MFSSAVSRDGATALPRQVLEEVDEVAVALSSSLAREPLVRPRCADAKQSRVAPSCTARATPPLVSITPGVYATPPSVYASRFAAT